MTEDSFESANEAKADFDDVYTAPTPHAYIESMAKTGYQIGEQARPYGTAAAEFLNERNGEAWPVQMLDLGCSYGIGSAFIKYGCSFDEMVAFFASRAPSDYRAACEATRMWLNVTPPTCNLRTVGLDSSEPAIRFGVDAGLLDGGIPRDFEEAGAEPTEEECAWLAGCNLLISTGAVGYVTQLTLDAVLDWLGEDHPGEAGPIAVLTILRMFDVSPIRAAFERHDFSFAAVPEVRLPQRRFATEDEAREVVSILQDRGLDTADWEERGRLFADLYVAARGDAFAPLLEELIETRSRLEAGSEALAYIRR